MFSLEASLSKKMPTMVPASWPQFYNYLRFGSKITPSKHELVATPRIKISERSLLQTANKSQWLNTSKKKKNVVENE